MPTFDSCSRDASGIARELLRVSAREVNTPRSIFVALFFLFFVALPFSRFLSYSTHTMTFSSISSLLLRARFLSSSLLSSSSFFVVTPVPFSSSLFFNVCSPPISLSAVSLRTSFSLLFSFLPCLSFSLSQEQ